MPQTNAAKRYIDCNVDPFIPDGMVLVEHQRHGMIDPDFLRTSLFVDEEQLAVRALKGTSLRKRLAGKPVANANMLEYWLRNPHHYPAAYKNDAQGNTLFVAFWGTIYCNPPTNNTNDLNIFVPCLFWTEGRLVRDDCPLACTWDNVRPAMLMG